MASVYGIQSGPFIKIGVANNIRARLHQMNLYNPHPCKVVLRRNCEDLAYFIEKQMHKLLAEHAIGREWFTITPAMAREAFKLAYKEGIAERYRQAEWQRFSSERAAQRQASRSGLNVESVADER